VAYPNEYRTGMANLGLHAVVEQAMDLGLAVDRAFLPDPRGLDEHRRTGTPLLSVEGERAVGEFDVIAFSISFEPDDVGMVQMLELAGLEPRADRRGERAPLVVAGGIAPTLNPEPIAPFCDLIGIGEAEALLPSLHQLLGQGLPKQEIVARARSLPGWYAPAFGPAPVVHQRAPLVRPCCPVALASEAAFSRHVDLEISRGCIWRCRFCAAGHVVTPYRELGLGALEEAIRWAIRERGRVGLVGTDVSDHSELEPIVDAIRQWGGDVAFPSLRVESLRRKTGVAARLVKERPPRSLTMAVEAASEGLREALGKRLPEEHILEAARLAAEAGVHHLRLYLLVGIPGERWEEVEAVGDLARALLSCGLPGGIALSVNGLVPKPGTPLQWEAAPDRDYLRRARDALRRRLPRGPVELAFESPDWTRWQALLSLGGREVSETILEAARTTWRRALARAEPGVDFLLGKSRWPAGALPWAHIERGTPPAVLREERGRCLARQYVPPSQVVRGPEN
jgi:radical SAM superfamily enzyme YgiQ (UPF0313 family)